MFTSPGHWVVDERDTPRYGPFLALVAGRGQVRGRGVAQGRGRGVAHGRSARGGAWRDLGRALPLARSHSQALLSIPVSKIYDRI